MRQRYRIEDIHHNHNYRQQRDPDLQTDLQSNLQEDLPDLQNLQADLQKDLQSADLLPDGSASQSSSQDRTWSYTKPLSSGVISISFTG